MTRLACRLAVAGALLTFAPAASAQGPAAPVAPSAPTLNIQIDGTPAGAWGTTLNIVLGLTLLTVAPAILVSLTSFTRILISLHFLRQAIGTQSAPGNQTLVGLALFLTWFVMAPVATTIEQQALGPLLAGEIDGPAALDRAWPTMREFLLQHTQEDEVALFLDLAGAPDPETDADIPARVLIPAFMISEIETAFKIGILLYLPFLMLEIIVSAVLLALGMMQLPPVVISTPLKLVLFVVVDGWNLVIGSLVRSFA